MTNDRTEPRPNRQAPAAAELDRLLSGLCDGTLGDDDRRLLSRRLADEPEARRLYLEYVDLHAVLVGRGPAAPMAEPDVVGVPGASPVRPLAHTRFGRWTASLAALAALVALAVWLSPELTRRWDPPVRTGQTGTSSPTRPPEPTATTHPSFEVRLTQLAGKVEVSGASGDSVEASTATPILPGRTVRTGPDDGFASLDFPDGSRVELVADSQLRLAGDLSGGVRLVLSRGALRADVKPQPAGRPMVVVTPQAEVVVVGTQFAVSAGDATAVETDVGKVRVVRTGDGRTADVPAGHFLVASWDESALEVRSTAALLTEPRSRLGFQRAHALAYSADGQQLTAVSPRQLATIRLGTAASEPSEPSADLGKDRVRALVSADGGTALVVGRNGEISVLDARSGRRRAEILTGFAHPPQAVAISPDGRQVAAYEPGSYKPGRVRVWDADGVERAVIAADTTVRALTFSPDGSRLAAATVRPGQFQDRRLIVWTVADGARVTSSVPLEVPLEQVTYSADGRRVAAADERGAVHLWDAATGEWLAGRGVADGWTHRVRSLTLSADGRLLAAGGTDGRVRLWDVVRGRDAATLVCGRRPVLALAFAPDGRTLAVGTVAGPVLLWDVPAASPQ